MKKLLLLFAISLMAMTSAFAETATFDFSTAEAQAAYTIIRNGYAGTLSAQQGVVKLDAKDNGMDGDFIHGLLFNDIDNPCLRICGQKSLFKFSVPTGYKITKIAFELYDERGFQHGPYNKSNNYTGPELTLSEDKSTETYTAPSDETVTEVAYEATSAYYSPRVKKVIVEYETPAEPALAALMGETKYKSEAGNSICVNEDGRITNMFEGSGELLANYYRFSHNEEGDFVAYGFGADSSNSFKFHVEGDKVTKIEEYQNYTLKYTFLPEGEEETPTDITDVEIVKPSLSKTIKVLKNGKIVIVKNGVTYDLSGSVIE